MKNETISSKELLNGTGLSVLDAIRLIKNALDFKPCKMKLINVQFCYKVIEAGLKHLHIKEMSIAKGFEQYLKTKSHLRSASLHDIKYLARRLFKANPKFSKANFAELTLTECETCLNCTFATPSQFNKAQTMLNGLFNYALRQEWCDKNVIKLIQRKKVQEKEIKALTISETKSLIKTTKLPKFKDCQIPLGLLLWAGIRPTELTRLKWQDIDLDENIITIRSQTSKTGGTRHIEIPKTLKHLLKSQEQAIIQNNSQALITPINWQKQFKKLRDQAGFKGKWIQDVLRHTYASYHTKHYKDLSRLQLNMGHSNQHLLRSRYVNLHNISKVDAKTYFSIAC